MHHTLGFGEDTGLLNWHGRMWNSLLIATRIIGPHSGGLVRPIRKRK